jgi:hypothetical protein
MNYTTRTRTVMWNFVFVRAVAAVSTKKSSKPASLAGWSAKPVRLFFIKTQR